MSIEVGDRIQADGKGEVFSVVEVLVGWTGNKSDSANACHYVVASKIKGSTVLKRVVKFRGYNWEKCDTDHNK